jgi:hypothetical protein
MAPSGGASIDAQEPAVLSDEQREDADQDSACQDEGERGAEHEPSRSGRIEPEEQGTER